jgi:hypothetical protein
MTLVAAGGNHQYACGYDAEYLTITSRRWKVNCKFNTTRIANQVVEAATLNWG